MAIFKVSIFATLTYVILNIPDYSYGQYFLRSNNLPDHPSDFIPRDALGENYWYKGCYTVTDSNGNSRLVQYNFDDKNGGKVRITENGQVISGTVSSKYPADISSKDALDKNYSNKHFQKVRDSNGNIRIIHYNDNEKNRGNTAITAHGPVVNDGVPNANQDNVHYYNRGAGEPNFWMNGFYETKDQYGNNRGIQFSSDGNNGVKTQITNNGKVIYDKIPTADYKNTKENFQGFITVMDSNGNTRTIKYDSNDPNGIRTIA